MWIIKAIWTHLLILLAGLGAIARLVGLVIGSLFGGGGSLKSRLIARFTSAKGQRLVFDVARAFLPNIAIKHKIITAYDNNGTAFVTRYDDVKEVLGRDSDFEVVYGPRMMLITNGANFFLGMQNTPEYTRDVSNMRLAARRSDVAGIVAPCIAREASAIVAATLDRMDVPQDLTLRVPVLLLRDYFGTPGPSEADMIGWTTILFWYLFIDLNADPALDARAMTAAGHLRDYLDAAIQARKASGAETDDILGRCLVMQRAGLPGMDDLGIRNNLVGLLIGLVPTTSKAAILALDQLLDRPEALAGAQHAARRNDDAALAAYVFEALRFNPVNPVIYRRATRDTEVAPNTWRTSKIRRGTMVMAANLSAMFDRLRIDSPNDFKTDRPWSDYMLWGDGMHTCFGAYINQVTIPGILKPLLQRQGLRRAAGSAGRIDTDGTPFPVHFQVEFDAG